MNEGAITQDNQAVVKQLSTGKVTTMSLSQLVKEQGKQDSDFKVLTNGELAEEREFNPQLINNSTVFSVIGYAKGMDKVKDEVYKIIDKLGHTSTTTATGGYGTSENDEGLSTLEAAAASGAFKIKDGSSVTSNSAQIQYAQAKLWQALSPAARATLRMRATSMVSDPGQIDSTAMNLAADLLSPHNTTVSKEIHDETYKKMGAGAAGAGNKPVEFGPHEAAYNFRTNITPIALQGPAGAKIEALGSELPNTVYQQGAEGKRSSLYDNTNLGKIAKVGTAFTADGKTINPKTAAITGSSYIAWLPVAKDPQTGNMRIDEDGAVKWAELQKEHPTTSPEILAGMYGASLNLRKLVVAEVTSFSDDHHAWFDDRNPTYYKRVDSDTENMVRNIVDPKGDITKHFTGNNLAHSHLVFMDTKDENSYRNADNHEATLPASVFSMNPYNADGTPNPNAYNTGAGGANIGQGMQFQPTTPTPPNLTSNYFNK